MHAAQTSQVTTNKIATRLSLGTGPLRQRNECRKNLSTKDTNKSGIATRRDVEIEETGTLHAVLEELDSTEDNSAMVHVWGYLSDHDVGVLDGFEDVTSCTKSTEKSPVSISVSPLRQ